MRAAAGRRTIPPCRRPPSTKLARRRCSSPRSTTSSPHLTDESPFARAFFTLVEGLGIVEPEGSVAT